MLSLRIVILLSMLLGAAALLWRIAPSPSKLVLPSSADLFPLVSGYNLNRQEFVFPRDFSGQFNLVIVPFQRYQQMTVDTWIPVAKELEASFPGLVYYELPTIYAMPMVSRTFLNEGMRAGIPDETARERTITLYLDKEAFMSGLQIPDEKDISLFLVDDMGEILWRSRGAYTPEKAAELVTVLQQRR